MRYSSTTGIGKTFSIKGQLVNILGFIGHTVCFSYLTLPFYQLAQKQPDYTCTNGPGYVQIKLCLQNKEQAVVC